MISGLTGIVVAVMPPPMIGFLIVLLAFGVGCAYVILLTRRRP